jgi:hypothetical protein
MKDGFLHSDRRLSTTQAAIERAESGTTETREQEQKSASLTFILYSIQQ